MMESFERQHPASNAGTTTTTPAAAAAGSTTTTSFVRYADAASAMERMRSSMIGSNLEFCPSKDILGQDAPKQSQQSQQSRIYGTRSGSSSSTTTATATSTRMERLGRAAGQIPAILLIGMFHLMIGIPFGVSYFPIGWREEQQETYTANLAAAAEDNNHHQQSPSDDDLVHGTFPILAKEALGIRMFLFSTIVGQLVFTLASGFRNPIALQMVENVPFCHALAQRVIRHQGYGTEALSTLMLLFGLSSVLVGTVFMILGQFNLGRIVYYFPNHVLVGCIAGIGVFLAKTGMEVTMDAVVTELWDHMDLVGVVLFFEVLLRILTFVLRNKEGKQLYSLLTPIYFCLMTPAFYLGLWIVNVTTLQDTTNEDGYFFPSLLQQQQKDGAHSIIRSIFNSDLVSMWTTIDTRTISWPAIVDSIPTMVALTLFSLIHVPINIPAFALSTNAEVDMNKELIAHGYSNLLSGFAGGLQNYMAYTQSVIYDKSGGTGKASGFAVAGVTIILYFIGPTVASFIPRCMAGTLLLHVGIDLFLEGVYDSYSRFDRLEYASVLLIITVMTLYGMDAAMIAGVLTAIFTFVAQNMTYIDPVRGSMPATTLRSDKRNRSHIARAILDDPITGRSRILVIQLQGHLFFGNMAHLTKNVHDLLSATFDSVDRPLIVIIDFSLVLGIDSSAAQAITRIKAFMRKQYDVQLSIFVSGSQLGFPCAFDLSRELRAPAATPHQNTYHIAEETTGLLDVPRISSHDEVEAMLYSGSHVSEDLNSALICAENSLIAKVNPALLDDDNNNVTVTSKLQLCQRSSVSDEKEVALRYLSNLCGADKKHTELLLSKYDRETYFKSDIVWKQGSPSTSVKLLVRGTLISELENEAGTSEEISVGNSIGELTFIEGVARMSSVKCLSDEAVVYSLSRQSYDELLQKDPHAARLIDLICIRYLSARVQHVSNRIFETRCLPI